jgi:sulfhydrogenase subunit alpha
LLYCGEWIESHALHVYLLHAPDFLGYESGIAMAADHRVIVEQGLRIKKLGNEILEVIGGRAIHPVNVKVGGFYRAPTRSEIRALLDPLRRVRDDALAAVQWVATFDFPAVEVAADLVAVSHPSEYPVLGERVASTSGLDIPVQAWLEHFVEEHVPWSTALHGHQRDGSHYLTGPLARYTLASSKLAPIAREAARDAGLGATCRNPFQSIIVRAVELLHAVDEAVRIVESYEPPSVAAMPVEPRAAVGHGVSEAPRGVLYHRYEIDDRGLVVSACIVPPTSQNQPAIEDDVRAVVVAHLDRPEDELQHLCEQAVRNHDPCISCATHFLDLRIEGR